MINGVVRYQVQQRQQGELGGKGVKVSERVRNCESAIYTNTDTHMYNFPSRRRTELYYAAIHLSTLRRAAVNSRLGSN